jgi:hypothetical protein
MKKHYLKIDEHNRENSVPIIFEIEFQKEEE